MSDYEASSPVHRVSQVTAPVAPPIAAAPAAVTVLVMIVVLISNIGGHVT